MILAVVCIVQAVALAAVVLGFLQHIRAIDREHGRRETLRINQALHAAGRTWEDPPAHANGDEPRTQRALYTVSPEQLPFN